MVETHNTKTQFSLRVTIVLTAAIAGWVWILRESTPAEMAVFTGAALTAGFVGHLVYSLLLPWRITVIVTVLSLYNAILVALMLLRASLPLVDCLESLIDVVVEPVQPLAAQRNCPAGQPLLSRFFAGIIR